MVKRKREVGVVSTAVMAAAEQDTRPIVSMEIVDRPLSTKQHWPIEKEVAAIAETVEHGKAVRLAFRTAQELKNIQMALRNQLTKQGLVMRYRKDTGERIVAWAEKVSEARK